MSDGMVSRAQRARRERAVRLAESFGGVVSRRALRGIGVDRSFVRREVAAQRWRLHGDQTVAVHTGVLSEVARWWRAVWEIGERIAVLEGASALHAAGLVGFEVPKVQVSVPHGCTPDDVTGVRWRGVVRGDGEVVGAGVPRVRTPIAAVRAAQWAATDRQAALVLAMVVQQRLATPAQLDRAIAASCTKGRTAVIRQIVKALAGGAQSLGELDFARMCRERGLPEPDRQAIVRTPAGRVYLDVRWTAIGLVVEIDGSGHRAGLAVSDDNLRQNLVTLRGHVVLRIDLIGLGFWPRSAVIPLAITRAITEDRVE